MKKALFIIALAVCGQGLQAAREPMSPHAKRAELFADIASGISGFLLSIKTMEMDYCQREDKKKSMIPAAALLGVGAFLNWTAYGNDPLKIATATLLSAAVPAAATRLFIPSIAALNIASETNPLMPIGIGIFACAAAFVAKKALQERNFSLQSLGSKQKFGLAAGLFISAGASYDSDNGFSIYGTPIWKNS